MGQDRNYAARPVFRHSGERRVLSMCLACWTARVAAAHAHLGVVGMNGGTCCLADWCIGSVLPYPPLNALIYIF